MRGSRSGLGLGLGLGVGVAGMRAGRVRRRMRWVRMECIIFPSFLGWLEWI